MDKQVKSYQNALMSLKEYDLVLVRTRLLEYMYLLVSVTDNGIVIEDDDEVHEIKTPSGPPPVSCVTIPWDQIKEIIVKPEKRDFIGPDCIIITHDYIA